MRIIRLFSLMLATLAVGTVGAILSGASDICIRCGGKVRRTPSPRCGCDSAVRPF